LEPSVPTGLSQATSTALDASPELPIVREHAGEPLFSGNEVRPGRYYGLTPYDAAYLCLAASRNIPLATTDSASARAARDLGVVVIPDCAALHARCQTLARSKRSHPRAAARRPN
jgi:hypothetical protein